MTIAFFSILNLQKDRNGVSTWAQELAQGLATKGHSAVMVTPYGASNSMSFKLLGLVARAYHHTTWGGFVLLNIMVKLYILWRGSKGLVRKASHLHAHDVFSAGMLLLTKPFRTIQLQAHYHLLPWNEFTASGWLDENSLSHRLMKRWSIWVLGHGRIQLLNNSKANQTLTQKAVPASITSSRIFYPGVIGYVESTPKQQPYLINVGTLSTRKNQTALLDILVELELQGLELPLVLVGWADPVFMNKLLARKAALGVKASIHFTGVLDTVETRRLMAGATLMIHTAREESFGRVLIESIASGTPVVALDYPAAHEILPDRAIYSRHLSLDIVGQHIARLLSQPEALTTLAEIQHRMYQARFTLDTMLSNYIKTIGASHGKSH